MEMEFARNTTIKRLWGLTDTYNTLNKRAWGRRINEALSGLCGIDNFFV